MLKNRANMPKTAIFSAKQEAVAGTGAESELLPMKRRNRMAVGECVAGGCPWR
jgi:hypothetical protein